MSSPAFENIFLSSLSSSSNEIKPLILILLKKSIRAPLEKDEFLKNMSNYFTPVRIAEPYVIDG